MLNKTHKYEESSIALRKRLFNGGALAIGADKHTLGLGRGQGAGQGAGLIGGHSATSDIPITDRVEHTGCSNGNCGETGKSFRTLDFLSNLIASI